MSLGDLLGTIIGMCLALMVIGGAWWLIGGGPLALWLSIKKLTPANRRRRRLKEAEESALREAKRQYEEEIHRELFEPPKDWKP